MSPSQPGPYQSKALSSVIKQTRRLIDQTSTALRRLKVTANWTAQTLLYPVYVVFQTIRLMGAQLRQAASFGLPGLRSIAQNSSDSPELQASLTSDTPIQKVLLAVQSFSLPTTLPVVVESVEQPEELDRKAQSPSFTIYSLKNLLVRNLRSWVGNLGGKLQGAKQVGGLSASPSELAKAGGQQIARQEVEHLARTKVFVRGIASLLETKLLVLVTSENQVLDILTPEQQLKLRQRIAWETAHYGRYLRLRQSARQLLWRSSTENPHLLLPVRLFRQLMGWVQSGKLAIAANLFQEASPPIPSAQNLLPATPRWSSLPFSGSLASLFKRVLGESTPAIAQSSANAPLLNSAALAIPLAPRVSVPEPIKAPLEAQPIFPRTQFSQEDEFPDYLDVDAIPVGYILSPLEQVLRWLDRCLLLIEKWLISIWKWLLSLVSKMQ
jgi:hypothetical protein